MNPKIRINKNNNFTLSINLKKKKKKKKEGYKERNNAGKGMCNTGKMVSICFLIGNITDML